MLAANLAPKTLNTSTEQHFWLALRKAQFTVEVARCPQCNAQGTLWGGKKLAMLISFIGTPSMPTIDKGILVLEDVNERPFRVERMLLQLSTPNFKPSGAPSSFSAALAARRPTSMTLAGLPGERLRVLRLLFVRSAD